MRREVKICGIKDADLVIHSARAGADLIGFNFYPRSPRSITLDQAAALGKIVPEGVLRVALFVDLADGEIESIVAALKPDILQLHGEETPRRCEEVRSRFRLPVMKAVPIRDAADIAAARQYSGAVDRFLFDAKPPKDMKNALPGGNRVSFDWQLLAGTRWPVPWLLAGGLDAENVGEAIEITNAPGVDVSSGVETSPGVKDRQLVTDFIKAARSA